MRPVICHFSNKFNQCCGSESGILCIFELSGIRIRNTDFNLLVTTRIQNCLQGLILNWPTTLCGYNNSTVAFRNWPTTAVQLLSETDPQHCVATTTVHQLYSPCSCIVTCWWERWDWRSWSASPRWRRRPAAAPHWSLSGQSAAAGWRHTPCSSLCPRSDWAGVGIGRSPAAKMTISIKKKFFMTIFMEPL